MASAAAVTLAVVVLLRLSTDARTVEVREVASTPQAVAVGDVTGDGRTDVVLTTGNEFSPPGEDLRVWVYAQTPHGDLADPVSYATAGTVSNALESVAVGDVTGDGRADVVLGVAELGVQVFPQLPSGVLGEPTLTPTRNGQLVRLGHLDGDDRLDVAALADGVDSYDGGTVSVLLADGSGGLRRPIEYAVGHGGRDDLEVADVTGDGRDDIVVMSGQLISFPNVSVLEQLPDGGFGPASGYSFKEQGRDPRSMQALTSGLGVGDVTGDERADVVVSHGGNTPDAFVAVFAQTESGTLARPMHHAVWEVPGAVEVADVRPDGRGDVVVWHDGWDEAGILAQQPDGSLAELELVPATSGEVLPHGLAVGDVDGDGLPEIVAASADARLVLLHLDAD